MKEKKTTLLIQQKNYPERLQITAPNRVPASCSLFHDSSKKYEQATAGSWTLPFSTEYWMQKMGADTVPEDLEC